VEELSVKTIRKYWWRVPAVAVIAAMLAYMGSFAFPASYQATTRLLIRGRDATVLSSTGQDLSNQPGVVDASLATALTETQAALLNSRDVATQVVDKLKLDAPEKQSGVGHVLKSVVSGTINRARAYLSHGFYKTPDRREQAIDDVAHGLVAKEVGNSYVLELTGTGRTAVEARNITDTAAGILVTISQDRGRLESGAHRDALKAQLDKAWAASAAAQSAVAKFKAANNISDLDEAQALTEDGIKQARQELTDTETDLSDKQAELATTTDQLQSTPSTKSNTTQIVTGRSSTDVSSTSDNSAYLSLLTNMQQLQAEVAGLAAKRDSIERSINQAPSAPGTVSTTEATLRQLQLQSDVAGDVVKSLNTDYQQAVSSATSGATELNRLDTAGLPNYPVKPTRWLFVALGLVFGGLIGFGWSYGRLRRHGLIGIDAVLLDDSDPEPVLIDLRELVDAYGNGQHSNGGSAGVGVGSARPSSNGPSRNGPGGYVSRAPVDPDQA